LKKTFKNAGKKISKPTIAICYTIKGKGINFAESKPDWHHRSSIDELVVKKMKEELRKA
jgi:transketolase